jgi:DNA-directed RNA polymerase specialized sigma24 family protein
MEKSETFEKTKLKADYLLDVELLSLFQHEPECAWDLFIKRYADFIFTQLHALGFDYDQAMDRFVYVCEKLSEESFRRLRTVRYAGDKGELTPWLRKVIKNLCINWAWSAEGRRRLFKPIMRLPEREQQIFELYFWRGLSPSEIYEEQRLDGQQDLEYIAVLDSLAKIFSVLNQQSLWSLLCNLARRRGNVSLDEIEEVTGREIVDDHENPEEILLQKETKEILTRTLDALSTQERLVIQLHFAESLTVKEVAEILHLKEQEVKNSLKTGMNKLRHKLNTFAKLCNKFYGF